MREQLTLGAFALSCAVAMGPGSLRGQRPDTVSDRDLFVAALPHASDTAMTRRVLGAPSHKETAKQPNDDGVLLTRWYYQGLSLSFDPAGRRYTAEITTSAHPTVRGVRVGDPFTKVRQAYGEPAFSDASHLLYARSTEDSETLGISFFFSHAKLTRIIVGEVISVE